METFGSRFKQQRELKGWTQEEIAEKIGVSRPTIAGYEGEKSRLPRKDTLRRIADLFDVSIDYLVGRTSNPKEQLIAFEETAKYKYFEKLEKDLGVDLSDPEVQEKLKRAAKIMFSGKD